MNLFSGLSLLPLWKRLHGGSIHPLRPSKPWKWRIIRVPWLPQTWSTRGRRQTWGQLPFCWSGKMKVSCIQLLFKSTSFLWDLSWLWLTATKIPFSMRWSNPMRKLVYIICIVWRSVASWSSNNVEVLFFRLMIFCWWVLVHLKFA